MAGACSVSSLLALATGLALLACPRALVIGDEVVAEGPGVGRDGLALFFFDALPLPGCCASSRPRLRDFMTDSFCSAGAMVRAYDAAAPFSVFAPFHWFT